MDSIFTSSANLSEYQNVYSYGPAALAINLYSQLNLDAYDPNQQLIISGYDLSVDKYKQLISNTTKGILKLYPFDEEFEYNERMLIALAMCDASLDYWDVNMGAWNAAYGVIQTPSELASYAFKSAIYAPPVATAQLIASSCITVYQAIYGN